MLIDDFDAIVNVTDANFHFQQGYLETHERETDANSLFTTPPCRFAF